MDTIIRIAHDRFEIRRARDPQCHKIPVQQPAGTGVAGVHEPQTVNVSRAPVKRGPLARVLRVPPPGFGDTTDFRSNPFLNIFSINRRLWEHRDPSLDDAA